MATIPRLAGASPAFLRAPTMTYAIIQVSWKRYRVHAGEKLLSDRLAHGDGQDARRGCCLSAGTAPPIFAPKDGVVTARVVTLTARPEDPIGKYKKRIGYKRHNLASAPRSPRSRSSRSAQRVACRPQRSRLRRRRPKAAAKPGRRRSRRPRSWRSRRPSRRRKRRPSFQGGGEACPAARAGEEGTGGGWQSPRAPKKEES